MVKTTISLEDDIYKKLVKEAVEKYGTTRTISKLINEKLKKSEAAVTGVKSEDEEIKKRLEIAKKFAGSWKTTESGAEYTRKIRSGWGKRLKRMGL